jgi:DNA polymerase-3 subunit gamma/tau
MTRTEPTTLSADDTARGDGDRRSRSLDASRGYTVLARRYRSREFDEIIGQDPIARTLRNAIAHDRIAHAYLFCGTRGVGKTSMARIFAKALNVSDELSEADRIAEAILRGEDLDVIEIDGASNRGVQEARDLIAAAGLSPARCPYKIYVIDEVHMLTRDAFNTLLKTMEEPPSHVKFILCTTEPNKVPATIQSRCQRFDFRSIPTRLIAEHLAAILAQERIEADEALIREVARLGNGSMRDALSLLDRLIAAGEGRLTIELAEQMFGLPDRALVVNLVDAVISEDPKAALEAGAELLARGASVEQALEMLAEHLRGLLVVSACGADSDLLDLNTEAAEAAARQAEHFDSPAIVHMIAICDATARNARGSATARALFDAALVRLCLSNRFADISTLLAGSGGGTAGAATEAKSAGAPLRKKKEREVTAPTVGRDRIQSTASIPREPAAASLTPDLVEPKPRPSPSSAEALWSQVLDAAASSPKDHAKVAQLTVAAFDGRTLELRVAERATQSARFLATQAESLADFVQRVTGRRVRVRIETPAPSAPPRTSAAAQEAARRLPLVQRAAEIFDAVITDLRDASETSDKGASEDDV